MKYLLIILLIFVVYTFAYNYNIDDDDDDSLISLFSSDLDHNAFLSSDDLKAIHEVEELNHHHNNKEQMRFQEQDKEKPKFQYKIMSMKKAIKKGNHWTCETDGKKDHECPYENGMCCIGGKEMRCCREGLDCYSNSTAIECMKVKTTTKPPKVIEVVGMTKDPINVIPHPKHGNIPKNLDIRPKIIIERIDDEKYAKAKAEKEKKEKKEKKLNKFSKKHKKPTNGASKKAMMKKPPSLNPSKSDPSSGKSNSIVDMNRGKKDHDLVRKNKNNSNNKNGQFSNTKIQLHNSNKIHHNHH